MRTSSTLALIALSFGALPASEPKVVFEDRFEGKLAPGWSWLREHPGFWRLREGALEIRVEPGVADTVKNALVRAAPDRATSSYAIEVTVRNLVPPTHQFEQAGITWYAGGRPVVKLVKECIDGSIYVYPGKVPLDAETVELRLVVSKDRWVGQFRPDAKGEFRTAAEGPLAPGAAEQVSIQCYNGPADAEHWIRFDDFRIVDLEPREEPTAKPRPLLHPLFSDHAVLQRDVAVPVWGWTAPGSAVKVSVDGKPVAAATADASGRWLAKLPALPAGGPHTLAVEAGPELAVREDILAGDVWIASGQSNMQWPVAASNRAAEEIAAANHPRLRLFSVPQRIGLEPEELVEGSWQLCSPATVGGFSAVAYFFGRDLLEKLDVPIGLVNTSWGGTVAEAWTSAEALSELEDFRAPLEEFRKSVEAAKGGRDDFAARLEAWWRANDPGSREGDLWAAPSKDVSDWKSMEIPAAWENAGLPGFDGIVWFRKDFELGAAWAGKEAALRLGPVDDRDATWVNGVRVGDGDDWSKPRAYKVPRGVLVAGRNSIAVRVLDTGGAGGLGGAASQYSLETLDGSAPPVPLSGAWKYRDAAPLSKLAPAPARPGSNPNVVTVLYNGMIAPLIPYAIRGAIWYQGESNADRPEQYRRLLPALIRDWRSRFGVGDFTFLVVQLANFTAPQKAPVESGWAELREAQLLTALSVPKVGLAVTIDIGEANDIHPRNKQDVGRRLALAALRIAYGKDIVWSGPIFRSMEVRGREARLAFDCAGGGLVARGGVLKGFAISGEDGVFRWADARIEGAEVIVSSPEVERPRAVRYGWANNPPCNLYNAEGLPASPFRTDPGK